MTSTGFWKRIEAYYRELQQYSEEVSGYRLLMGVSTNHTDYKHIQAASRESVMRAHRFPQ